ncbi:MAG: hypothetical protein HY914_07920 [Desulfomonile tiedjei]|nr:hypothetical protein [Desulfomonile tiedjei]
MADISQIRFRFLAARPGGPVAFEAHELDLPVPLSNPASSAEGAGPGFTYRTYLYAMRDFILRNMEPLTTVISTLGCPGPVEAVDIISEKHGSDYHPARIVVHTPPEARSFVLNVAVTRRGKERLQRDFDLMSRLGRKGRSDYLPEAYFFGEQTISDDPGECARLFMFLGQWFEKYHEFHPALDERTGIRKLLLWDLQKGYQFLSPDEEAGVFRQAAMILTLLYDTETFEEVFPWHHAAGDFVVSLTDGAVDVKLITIRQYVPRAVFQEDSPRNQLLALSLFFAGLTLRMRLDRLDGVGNIMWADDRCLDATIRGFFDGMQKKADSSARDKELTDAFQDKFGALSLQELAELFRVVVDSYDEASPDGPVIQENLVDHVIQVYARLEDFGAFRC